MTPHPVAEMLAQRITEVTIDAEVDPATVIAALQTVLVFWMTERANRGAEEELSPSNVKRRPWMRVAH
jgi:hypothetical protein